MEEQTSKSQPEKPKKSEKPGRNSNEALNWRARIAGKILDNSAKTGSINKNTFQKKYNEALEKGNAKLEKPYRIPDDATRKADPESLFGFKKVKGTNRIYAEEKIPIMELSKYLNTHITNIYLRTDTSVHKLFPVEDDTITTSKYFRHFNDLFTKKLNLPQKNTGWGYFFIRLDFPEYADMICKVFELQKEPWCPDPTKKYLREPLYFNYDVIYTSAHRSCVEIAFDMKDFSAILFDICTLMPRMPKSKSKSKSESE